MKVFLGIPETGQINTKLTKQLMKVAFDKDIVVHFENHRPVDSTRNKIVNEFLKTDCTHLAMIDSDMATFKPLNHTLKILAKADKPVISALAIFPNKFGINANLFGIDETSNYFVNEAELWNLSRDIIEVPFVGTGLIVIKREVVEAVKKQYKLLFKFEYNEEGIKIAPEDSHFCMLARKCGFDIFLHKKILTNHFKAIDLMQVHMQQNRLGLPIYDRTTGELRK